MAARRYTFISTTLLVALSFCSAFTHADAFTYDIPTLLANKKLGTLTLPVSQTQMDGTEIQLTLTLKDAVAGTVILQNPDGIAAKSTMSGTLSYAFSGTTTDENTQTIVFRVPAGTKIDGDWTLSIRPQTLLRKRPATLMQWTLAFPEAQQTHLHHQPKVAHQAARGIPPRLSAYPREI